MQAMYLMIGAEAECRQNDGLLDNFQGHLNLAENCAAFAVIMAQFDAAHYDPDEGYPSVFLYEVTEEMGAWIARNPGHHVGQPGAFLDELAKVFATFLSQGVPHA